MSRERRGPRRLCMLVHAYYPLGEPRVQREARAARESGYAVDVICLRAPGEPSRESLEGVEIRRLPIAHRRGGGVLGLALEYAAFTALSAGVLAAAAVRRTYDVLHVHSPPDFLVLAALLPRWRGARLLLDIHDLSPDLFGARFTGRAAALVTGALRWLQRAACALSDHVITVHEPYRRELSAGGVPAEKVAVVMNAIDPALLDRLSANGAPDAPERAPDGAFTIAYHGTLTAWYGVDLIIEAMHDLTGELPDARGLILGQGDALQPLRALAARRELATRVTFSGRYLPIEAALAQVRTADCGVVPNRPTVLNRFALSSKLFEYVALGVPAVVSGLPTLREHFSDREVTFFTPGDAGALADALRWVAASPDEARAKAERAAHRARAYAWSDSRARYLELLGGDTRTV